MTGDGIGTSLNNSRPILWAVGNSHAFGLQLGCKAGRAPEVQVQTLQDFMAPRCGYLFPIPQRGLGTGGGRLPNKGKIDPNRP